MEIQDAYTYIREKAAQLKVWNFQINLLEAKVDSARADIKALRAKLGEAA